MSKFKVAIVTGSATDVGAKTAELLASKGARVLINYTKSRAEAEVTASNCRALGGEALLVQGDVAKDEDCRNLAAAALAAYGQIDYLVNNAGTTKFAGHRDLEALSAADFQEIYGVNLIGAYQMIRAVAPAMQARGTGAIVNVSSIAAVTGIGSSVAYAASKGALNTLTISLARSLAPEIRVNAVCPGLIETRWRKDAMGDEWGPYRDQSIAAAPLQKICQPEDVADAIFWLLEGAKMVTGECLLVDGGAHLAMK